MYGNYYVEISFPVAKVRCYGNQLILRLFADVEIDLLHSLLWHSETECNVSL